MGSKISLKNYINLVLCYLKREKIENSGSYVVAKFGYSEILETFTSSSTGMEFVLIPPGEFYMGSLSEEQDISNSEYPVYKVTIENPFYMGKSQVTQKQWKHIMWDSPSHFRGEDRPVEMVSWYEVQEFVEKLNTAESTDKYRLPSEAEWEYACRAGTQTRYSFGDDESKLNECAWYAENSDSKTHLISWKQPNPWGLYDMHGNVWEWVQDKWQENYNGSPSDEYSWEDGDCFDRVSRGGSWYCDTKSCCSASRFGRDPESRFSNLGFRLLREL
ncbi:MULTISPECIES: formylglycine-generating enzyme family protein [unclassified Methanosarcina]|uniref:formylglycine-generating enzyme family protein n=1 Tax=unclassified Methanosarcina TaxID=2644672 RepID=UPI000615DDCA|nr:MULTISPECIES: formylglycine-generating enzyme family protein [unclassified Methanosarcina]AKB19105.1 serine/threonine kinase [Methanosarcina sp. WWM596]AKB23065.1 serine/threonine kinase [Methanosarcina sp. WH1]